MAGSKRKLQEDATHPHKARYKRDALAELTLHVQLRIAEAKRLGLQRVRLQLLDMVLAETLFDILRREVDADITRNETNR